MHRPGYINEQRKRELLYFLNKKKKTFFFAFLAFLFCHKAIF